MLFKPVSAVLQHDTHVESLLHYGTLFSTCITNPQIAQVQNLFFCKAIRPTSYILCKLRFFLAKVCSADTSFILITL